MKNLADMELLEIAEKFLERSNVIKDSFDTFAKSIVSEGICRHSDIWSMVYDWTHGEIIDIPVNLETALTEYIEVHYLHKKEETVWICVYKDTIRRHNDNDNLAHIKVLKSFAERYYKQQTDSEWKTFEEFLGNYTADETDDFYVYAKKNNAILEMDLVMEGKQMKNFMLISVRDRIMSYSYYSTIEEAQAAMSNEAKNSCWNLDEYIADELAEINETSAWVTNGNNHDNYDWWIVDQRKSVYEFMCLTQGDYDINDSELDTSVTVVYIEESDDNDTHEQFCIELLKKVKLNSFTNNCVEADWSALIRENKELFTQFMKENWKQQYTDEEEFIYQWIKEIHLYLAGYTYDDMYAKMLDVLKIIKQLTYIKLSVIIHA